MDQIDFFHHPEADILVAISTVKGYVSWRSPTHGSYFIRTLLIAIKYYAKNECLLSILFRAQRYIASRKYKQLYRQQPVINCKLRKKFYFLS